MGPSADQLARWRELTGRILPGMARARGWPISADHCFMRVCLDAACGRPWFEVIERPASRHADRALFGRAVAIAEAIADGSMELGPLNRRSIEDRARSRAQ